MKLLKYPLISILMAVAVPWLWNAAEAGTKTCLELVHPLHKYVNRVHEQQAGLWDLFENMVQLQNHSILALRLDSKISALLSLAFLGLQGNATFIIMISYSIRLHSIVFIYN